MVPLKNLSLTFLCLFALGTALTIPIYRFDLRRFARSSVFIKILFWAPIFAVFIGLLYVGNPLRLAVLTLFILLSLGEIYRHTSRPRGILLVYWLLFTAGMAHLAAIGAAYSNRFVNILVTLVLGTVLADVAAYFAGNYAGRHYLPVWLNPRKSWEGVAGEILGASLGILVVNRFIEPVISLWLFIPIGLGCVIGDLANSYFKRRAGVKDWSRAIPGHGGFTDRLSSLAGSAILAFYFLKIFGL